MICPSCADEQRDYGQGCPDCMQRIRIGMQDAQAVVGVGSPKRCKVGTNGRALIVQRGEYAGNFVILSSGHTWAECLEELSGGPIRQRDLFEDSTCQMIW